MNIRGIKARFVAAQNALYKSISVKETSHFWISKQLSLLCWNVLMNRFLGLQKCSSSLFLSCFPLQIS